MLVKMHRYLGDDNVTELFQILQLDINEDNGGELTSYFDVTESDGETYSLILVCQSQ